MKSFIFTKAGAFMNFREVLISIKYKTCVQCGKKAKGFKTTGKRVTYYCKDCLYSLPKINTQAYVLSLTETARRFGECQDFYLS